MRLWRLLHVTGRLRLTVTWRVTVERGVGGFSLWITGVRDFPGLSVLSVALPHVQLPPSLLSNLENQGRPGGAVTHQVP